MTPETLIEVLRTITYLAVIVMGGLIVRDLLNFLKDFLQPRYQAKEIRVMKAQIEDLNKELHEINKWRLDI